MINLNYYECLIIIFVIAELIVLCMGSGFLIGYIYGWYKALKGKKK